MANSVMEQGEKYIHKQKKRKQWMIAFICVAVVAVSGTIAALMINGQALNHTRRVLNCKLEVHKHEEQCYSQVEGEEDQLICGYADYVVHVHNDDCYGEDGQLVCQLPEIKPHTHTEECYQEQKFLICEKEEVEPHTHGEGCYEMRPTGAPAEGTEPTEGMEPEKGVESAEGTEAGGDVPAEGGETGGDVPAEGPQQEPVLTCTLEETEGHIHGEECYETRKVLACGQLELHTHDEELCYEEVETVDEDGNPITVKNLICDIPVLYEHVHGEDCFEVVELSGEEVGQLNEAKKEQETAEGEEGQQPKDETDPEEGQEESEEGETDLAENGTETAEGEGETGLEPGEDQDPEEAEPKPYTKEYKGETFTVTASYGDDAEIPEDAQLRVEPVAENEENEDNQADAVQELLGEAEPSAKLVYTIGFYQGDQEIEPKGTVTITIQLPEDQKVAPGAPVTVIHYGKNGPEAIPGSNVVEKDGKLSLSFDSSVFSKFMIVIGEPAEEENPDASGEEKEENEENGGNPDGTEGETEPKTEKVSYKLQDSFLYENDDFMLTLRVVGTATAQMPVEQEPAEAKQETEGSEDAGADADTQKPDTTAPENTAKPKNQEPAAGTEGIAQQNTQPQDAPAGTEGTQPQGMSGNAAGTDEAQATGDAGNAQKPGTGADISQKGTGNKEADTVQKSESEGTQDAFSGASNDGTDGTEADQAKDQIQQLNAEDVTLDLEFLDQKDAVYQEMKEFAQNEDGVKELLDLSVMRYSLVYEEVPLDISECDVRIEVALKEKAAVAAEKNEDAESKDAAEGTDETQEPSEQEQEIGEGDAAEEPGEGEDTFAKEPGTDEESGVQDVIEATNDSVADTVSENGTPEGENVVVSLMQINRDQVEKVASKALMSENGAEGVLNGDIVVSNATDTAVGVSLASLQEPKYTVQYYAWLDTFFPETETLPGDAFIPLIDTSGGILPQNGVDPPLKNMALEKKNGVYEPVTSKKLREEGSEEEKAKAKPTKIYATRENVYGFYDYQNPENVDILYKNDNYSLEEIWVLKENVEGVDPEGSNKTDWDIFPDPSAVKFVYNPDPEFATSVSDNRIRIVDGKTIIRLVYSANRRLENFGAEFYDYDISDGNIYDSKGTQYKTSQQTNTEQWFAKTNEQGINKYTGTGAKLAFGNANAGDLNLQNAKFKDAQGNEVFFNRANWRTKGQSDAEGYNGCAFGIVTGLNGEKIKYAEGVIAPDLFGSSEFIGKSVYNNWSLSFKQVGDTYTLTSVHGDGERAHQLDCFKENGSRYTNNFWPMDNTGTHGTEGHDLKFGDESLEQNRRFGTGTYDTLPIADDKQDHNAYFGMHFPISFTYSEDYCGPLEYCFYGDDDMWVFLDGQLVCDIGGVHVATGEYVNLWDYLEDKPSRGAGKHTLDIFYTERGASGSTCFMQFTLPKASAVPLKTGTKNLRVMKKVDGPNEDGKKFTFKLQIINNDSSFPYRIVREDSITEETTNGKELEFSLGNGEFLEVTNLSINTQYTVTETEASGYIATVSVNGSEESTKNTVSGTIEEDKDNMVIFTNHTSYELPKTGSSGVIKYTFGGIAVIITAAGLMYGYQWKRRRERRNQG